MSRGPARGNDAAAARWPEFWLSWEPVMKRLADRYALIAPDLRGSGTAPSPRLWPRGHTECWRGSSAGRCPGLRHGHEVGGAAMQPLARTAPERLAGLFFFDFAIPALPRMAAPDRLNEIRYQSFNQMEMAPGPVGATRDSCRMFIAHFLRHWSHRKEAFDDVTEAFTDNFRSPESCRRLCPLSRRP